MFKYRIRFLLAPGYRLDHPAQRLEIDLGDTAGRVELIGRSEEKSIATASELILRSLGLPSQEIAEATGHALSRSLLLAAVRARMGVDLGRNAEKSLLSEYGRTFVAEQMGYAGQVLNDDLGLVIYYDPGGTRFAKVNPATMTVHTCTDDFIEALRNGLAYVNEFNDKHVLALELYSATKFESSTRARFLTLLTVVEVLAVRTPRADVGLQLLSRWREDLATSHLPHKEKQQLTSSLRDLEKASIGASCRELLRSILGTEAESAFSKWYKARGELVHSGQTSLDLRTAIGPLDQTVTDLLLSVSAPAI